MKLPLARKHKELLKDAVLLALGLLAILMVAAPMVFVDLAVEAGILYPCDAECMEQRGPRNKPDRT